MSSDDQKFHIIFAEGTPEVVERITTSLDVARDAMETHKVKANATGLEALWAADMCNAPLHRIMNDTTWQAIAPYADDLLKKLRDTFSGTQAATFVTTPPDLPPGIAERRYDLMRRSGRVEDLSASIECVEIMMAANHHRTVNRELFSEESRTALLWDDLIEHTSVQELDEEISNAHERIGEMQAEVASESAAFGDASPGAYRMIDRQRHELFELEYQRSELDALDAGLSAAPGAR